jgi:hypothetical protein
MKLLSNLCHLQSTLIGVGIIAIGALCMYKGIIPSSGFVAICIGAAFPILGIGKKKEA